MSVNPFSLPPLFPFRDTTFRVFVASTFRAVQGEREVMINRIIPELRRRSMERGLPSPEVNLYWELGQLRPSSEEKSVPWAVGLTRHYSVSIIFIDQGPEPAAVNGGVLSEGEQLYSWLKDAARQGNTDANTEAVESILNDPMMRGRVFFYLRHAASGERSAAKYGHNENVWQRTTRLIKKIRRHGHILRFYDDLDTAATQIRIDILGAFEKFHAIAAHETPLDIERRAHAAFASRHYRAYVERSEYVKRLDAHLEGVSTSLVVCGPSGVGKSALAANWYAAYLRRHPDVLVIAHFVGATAFSNNYRAIIRRVVEEIGGRYGMNDGRLPDDEEPAATLAEWLAHVRTEPLVLIIDALDQLDEESQMLEWLPQRLQQNVRLIVSTTPDCTAYDKLEERGWDNLASVQPLTHDEQRRIVESVLGPLGISLTEEQFKRVANSRMSTYPLPLRLALEQLGIAHSEEDMERLIDSFLTVDNLEQSFDTLLTFLEETQPEGNIREVLSLVWGARNGLSREDLMELAEMPSQELASVLSVLDHQFIRPRGLLTFFYDQLRHAVAVRYELNGDAGFALHRRLASYFRDTPLSTRRCNEEPWQWKESIAWEELKECITDIPMVLALRSEERDHEILSYWLAIGDRYLMASSYRNAFERYVMDTSDDDSTLAAIATSLGELLHQAAEFDAAIEIFQHAVELRRKDPDAMPTDLADIQKHLGTTLQARGLYNQAEDLFKSALEAYESAEGDYRVQIADMCERLGGLYLVLDKNDAAEMNFTRALDIYRDLYGDSHKSTLSPLNALGVIARTRGSYDQAKQIFDSLLPINEALYGPEHPLTAVTLNNIATVEQLKGDYRAASKNIQRAIGIAERHFGPKHPTTALYMGNLGMIQKLDGDHEGAKPLYDASLEVLTNSHRVFSTEVADCLNNIGAFYRSIGSFEEANRAYDKALKIREKVLGPMHVRTVNTRLNIAGLRALEGKKEEAAELYCIAVRQKIEVSGLDHPETRRAIRNYSKLLDELGWGDEDLPDLPDSPE